VFTLPRPPSVPCLLKFQLLLSPAVRASHLPITTRGSEDTNDRLCCEFRDRGWSLSKFAAEQIIRSRPVGSEPLPLHCTAFSALHALHCCVQDAQSPSHCTALRALHAQVAQSPSHLHCTVCTAMELGKPTSLPELPSIPILFLLGDFIMLVLQTLLLHSNHVHLLLSQILHV